MTGLVGGFAVRRARLVLVAAMLAVAGFGVLGVGAFGKRQAGGFQDPGAESATATTKPHRPRASAASTSRSWAASPGRTAWCHHGQRNCITTSSSGRQAGS